MIYVETQWDPQRQAIVLLATTGFAGDRYTVTRPAVTEEDAVRERASFIAMYRDMGCEVRTRARAQVRA